MNNNQQSTRHFLKSACLLTGAVAAQGLLGGLPAALAQPAEAPPREGQEYRLVKPAQNTDSGKKIEVIEFFWLGCPHCFALEPVLKDWIKKLPADVAVRKVHVPFQEVKHQQLYYTLEAMGKAEEFTDKVFQAIHGDRNRLDTPEKMADFVAKNGLDRKQFMDTYASFAVQTSMRRATAQAAAWKVDGVPALGVNGKYYTAPAMAGGNAAALKVVEYLVEVERKGAK